MDKSGNSNNSKESGPSAAFNSSNIWLAAPKTFVWAREKLDGCERDRCCKVMLDADVYFRTAHEYFKAFTKCWEEKKDSDAKLSQQKVLWSELVEKVCMLQAAFSQVAREKEALRAENGLLVPDNVELRSRLHEQQSQLHEQQALGVRLQEKVHELEDDVQGLQEQFGELQVRCDGLEEELKVKDMENNKLRTSLEQGTLDASKIEEKPKAVPDVIKKGPPLALAAKRQSVDSDDEVTFVACVKRIKESEPTAPSAAAVVANDQQKPAVAKDQQTPAVPPVVANDQQKPSVPPVVAKDQEKPSVPSVVASVPPVVAKDQQKPSVPPVVANGQQPMQAPENANGSFSQSNILVEEFWYIMKEREQALLSGSTTARALVDQFMLTWPACIELEQHQQAAIRHDLVQFADSIFDFIRQNNALPPLKIKNHQFLVNNEHTVPSRN